MRKVWRDIADMNLLESNNKLVTNIHGLPFLSFFKLIHALGCGMGVPP